MVDKTLISQLQSMNATQRKEAIMALGRTKDREAIPHLSRVAETDPIDELRGLARKAAIYIDKNAPIVNVKPFRMPWDDEDDEDEVEEGSPINATAAAVLPDYGQPTPEEISEQQDREWADRFMERAWEAYYISDREGAEMYLRKAFERYPKLVDTETAREAAAKIMNMNPDRAVSTLLKPKTLRRAPKPDSLSKRPTTSTKKPATLSTGAIPIQPEGKTIDEIEDGSFGTLLRDLLIYFVLVAGFIFALLFILTLLRGDNFVAPSDPTVGPIAQFIVDVDGGAFGLMLLYALIAAVGAGLHMLLWSFLMHIVATTLLGGNSTFPRLINQTYLYHALSTPTVILLLLVGIIWSAVARDSGPIWTALAVAILVSIFWLAFRLGVAYRFDFARGCFTMILSQLALACCSVTFTLGIALAGIEPFATSLEFLMQR